MLYLGIDPGTVTGFAAMTDEGVLLRGGHWTFDLDPGLRPGRRFVQFCRTLSAFVREMRLTDPKVVLGFEQSYPETSITSQMYGGWLACIALVCEQQQVDYVPVHYATAKAHALSGRATKAQMVQEARNRGGLRHLRINYHDGELDTHGNPKVPTFPRGHADEADAYWIADTLRAAGGKLTIKKPGNHRRPKSDVKPVSPARPKPTRASTRRSA